MTVPHWRRSPTPTTLTTPVAVVGAGIAGLSAALHLQDLGLDGILLEKHAVGSGASTRNAGFLMRGAADNYFLARIQYGQPIAQALWQWTQDNLTLLRLRGIESLPSYAARPSALLALEPAERHELEQSLTLLKQDGFDARWIGPDDAAHHDAVWTTRAAAKPLGALINPNDAVINPHDLLAHLRKQLRWPIHELTEVAEVRLVESSASPTKSGGEHIELLTPDALIRADRALLCLNAYAQLLLPNFASLIEPNRGQMLALHATESQLPLRYAYYANRGSEYFRRADASTVVVGGCRTYHAANERTYDDRHTDEVQQDLERFAESRFGKRFPVKARWSGTMGFTPDHLPLIGPIPNHNNRLHFCGGFTGHGMSLAHKATQLAAQLLTEQADPAANPFPLSRFL
jgi:gamma-glutamylputrescine oxidase